MNFDPVLLLSSMHPKSARPTRRLAAWLLACAPAPVTSRPPAAHPAAATSTSIGHLSPESSASSTRPPQSSGTAQPASPTSTRQAEPPSADCRPADAITLDDVGQERCITGTVVRAYNATDASYVDLGAAFYLLSYDLDLSAISAGACLELTDEIGQLGQSPVIVVVNANPPAACGQAQTIRLPRRPPAGDISPTRAGSEPPTSTQPPSPTWTPQPTATSTPLPPPTQAPPPPPPPPPPNCDPPIRQFASRRPHRIWIAARFPIDASRSYGRTHMGSTATETESGARVDSLAS